MTAVNEMVSDLIVRWTMTVQVSFDPQLLPPSHMPVVYGPVKSRKAKAETSQKDVADGIHISHVCTLCKCSLLVCILCCLKMSFLYRLYLPELVQFVHLIIDDEC